MNTESHNQNFFLDPRYTAIIEEPMARVLKLQGLVLGSIFERQFRNWDVFLKPGARGLDIGCGGGFLLQELLKLFPCSSWTGIDINESLIKIARMEHAHAAEVTIEQTGVLDFRSNEQFDLVVGSAVAQYFYTELDQYVEHLKSLMKPDGIFIGLESFIPTEFCYPETLQYQKFRTALFPKLMDSKALITGLSLLGCLEKNKFVDIRAELVHVHRYSIPRELYIDYMSAVFDMAYSLSPDQLSISDLEELKDMIATESRANGTLISLGGLMCIGRNPKTF